MELFILDFFHADFYVNYVYAWLFANMVANVCTYIIRVPFSHDGECTFLVSTLTMHSQDKHVTFFLPSPLRHCYNQMLHPGNFLRVFVLML